MTTSISEVFIPETPPQRSYTCPSCKKSVKTFRVGNSASYLVMDADDEKHEHDCKYKGSVPITLLGYKPPKKEKPSP
jgi:hypothetical protein